MKQLQYPNLINFPRLISLLLATLIVSGNSYANYAIVESTTQEIFGTWGGTSCAPEPPPELCTGGQTGLNTINAQYLFQYDNDDTWGNGDCWGNPGVYIKGYAIADGGIDLKFTTGQLVATCYPVIQEYLDDGTPVQPEEPTGPQCTEGTEKTIAVPFSIDQMSQAVSTGQTYSVDGCEYTMTGNIQMCYDAGSGPECSFTATSTGNTSEEPSATLPPANAVPLDEPAAEQTPYSTETTTTTGSPDDGCITNGDKTICQETTTETTIKNLPDYLEFNPETGAVEFKDQAPGTVEMEWVTVTETDNVTGETTVTETVTQTTVNGGDTTTIINNNGTTTISNPPTSSTSTQTTTSGTNADGTPKDTKETSDEEPSNGSGISANYGTTNLPTVTKDDFYTSSYPDGFGSMISSKFNELKSTAFVSSIEDNFGLGISSGGSYPSWTFSMNIGGIANLGTHTLELPLWVWDVIGYIVLVSAALASRSIIFGG